MRHLFWPIGTALVLVACGPAQETADTAEEDAFETQPELVDPVVQDPMDDTGMPPPDMLEPEMPEADMGQEVPDDPAMAEEPAAEDETEPEDPAAPDGG